MSCCGEELKNVYRFGQNEPIKFVNVEGRNIILDGNHRTALNFALRKQFTRAEEVQLPFGTFRNNTDVLESVIPRIQVTQSSAVRFFRRPGENR